MLDRLKKRKCVAIDYDRRELRLVVYDYVRKTPTVLALHTAAIPETVDVADATALGGFLKGVVGKLGLAGARTVMCVSRGHAVLKSLMLPGRPSTNDLPGMVMYQVAKELPFSAEEAVVDHTRGSHWDTDQQDLDEGTTVLAAAVRLPIIETARETCTTAGLKLERLGLRPYACLRAVRRCVQAPGKRLLLVNVTANEAEIDVIRDDMLEFSRAATLFLAGEESADGAPANRAESVERIVAEVTRSLHSFHAVQRGAEIDGVVLAGNTGIESDAAAALAKSLGVRAELLDVARGFAVARDAAASAFVAALGLCTGEAGEELPFDFLNPKRPVAPVDTRRTKALAAVAVAIAVFGGLFVFSRVHLARRDAALGKLAGDIKKLETDQKALSEIDARVVDAEQWVGDEMSWLDQLAAVSRVLPDSKAIYLDSFRCSPPPPATKRNKGARFGKIALTGRVKDNASVPQAEKKLLDPGYTVSHKATSPIRDKFDYGVKFNVDVLVPVRGKPTTRPAATRPANKTGKGGGS